MHRSRAGTTGVATEAIGKIKGLVGAFAACSINCSRLSDGSTGGSSRGEPILTCDRFFIIEKGLKGFGASSGTSRFTEGESFTGGGAEAAAWSEDSRTFPWSRGVSLSLPLDPLSP